MSIISRVMTVLLVATCGLGAAHVAAQPQPGDIVVVDPAATSGGALFVVNPVTGRRTLLSDFGNAVQGPLGRKPWSVAVSPSGNYIVADQSAGTDCTGFGSGCGAIFSVDRLTGQRAMISDFGAAAQGPVGSQAFGVALDGNGVILATSPYANSVPNVNDSGALFEVDFGGTRKEISNFTNVALGPTARPFGLAILGPDVLVAVAGPVSGKVVRVNRSTGARTLVTDVYDASQGHLGFVPIAVAVDPVVANRALFLDQLASSTVQGEGMLFSVDLSTGVRTVVSDFTNPAQGPLGFNLSVLAFTAEGDIRVVDFDAGSNSLGAVFKVDRATGQRDCLSDFGSAAQGPLGAEPAGLAIVPGIRPPGLGIVAAVLPASRSVMVGATATAFVTVINTGATTARAVGVTVGCRTPIEFSYQTTDPRTNGLTGAVNTPVDIPAGGTQTFVIAMKPTGAFAPTDLAFTFGGDNTAALTPLTGLNTLLLSGSTIPVPDVVALAATAGNDGIVNIPGATGTGAFAVASVNVGAGSPITVSADTGAASLPVSVQLCETNPATGACISPVGSSVATSIAANATPTFAVFVAATDTVSFDPAANRVFVRFRDNDGVTRGATSVAVRTQ